MSNIDWSQVITKEMKEIQALVGAEARMATVEDAWRVAEVPFIADQLLAIEDDDPTALPGTERQWRDYRTAVRAWKLGTPNFPYQEHRPTRPH